MVSRQGTKTRQWQDREGYLKATRVFKPLGEMEVSHLTKAEKAEREEPKGNSGHLFARREPAPRAAETQTRRKQGHRGAVPVCALGRVKRRSLIRLFSNCLKPLQTFFSTSSSSLPFFSSSEVFLFPPFPSFLTSWAAEVSGEPGNEVKTRQRHRGERSPGGRGSPRPSRADGTSSEACERPARRPHGRRGRVQALLRPAGGAWARPLSGKRTQLYPGLRHDTMSDTHRFLSINRDVSKIHKATLPNKFGKTSSAKKGLRGGKRGTRQTGPPEPCPAAEKRMCTLGRSLQRPPGGRAQRKAQFPAPVLPPAGRVPGRQVTSPSGLFCTGNSRTVSSRVV